MRRMSLVLAAIAGVFIAGAASAAPVFHLSGWKASAGKPETFTIARISGNGGATISFRTGAPGDSAQPPADYTATTQTIAWGPHQTSATVAVPTFANPAQSGNIQFTATISSATGSSSAQGLIMEPAAPPPAPSVTWIKCADENGTCTISGTANVRYGSGTTWLTQLVTGSISCSNSVFGDPLPGVVKECDTDGTAVAPAPTPAPAPAPAPSGSWVATTAPLQVGSYAFLKNQGSCCNGLIVKIVDGGMTNDADPALRRHWWTYVYYADPSGNFPAANAYWASAWMTGYDDSLQGAAPAP